MIREGSRLGSSDALVLKYDGATIGPPTFVAPPVIMTPEPL
jgi:hypothetical protein